MKTQRLHTTHHFARSVGFLAALSVVLPLGLAAGASSAGAVSYGGVTFTGDTAAPTITVTGSGFGHEPKAYSAASTTCGKYGRHNGDWFGQKFIFEDTTGGWSAGLGKKVGPSSNCIGLVVGSWTGSKIVFQFGKAYPSEGYGWLLNSGDSFTIAIKGIDFSGTVAFAS